ncbi:hypothetical protein D0Z07_0644 [Hyphodiscus hymeniophilus]|uniref:Uncharacterized protein n=1 Tax=Hyphodiscus hymeniophilus TaxID=353542 RepID=A0A9P6VSK7_9HELO|nr:hypothetical protein D0Z07_0644 [Hyphodiscus hymeniophilus]
MLAIRKSKKNEGKCIPNVLPCRINRNGHVNVSRRYWNPTKATDGKTIAYFRGRKLHGKQLKMPDGYRGVVLSSSDAILPQKDPARAEAREDDDEEEPEVKIMEEQGVFEEIMVWGHEAVMDEFDPYVRGLEEWIGFAEQIHSCDADDTTASKETK